jgi:EAL domain-containing protein (putative c-di-GMP-specific phosphodiesterase class I)
MQDAESSVSLLAALKALGVQLAIDDFGTGYSSLSYLKRFPIDILKIDQSFVRDVATSSSDAAIVNAILSMGKSLNQRVIAEGVETPDQLAFLRTWQCDTGQGFLFSHPVPAATFEDFLANGMN